MKKIFKSIISFVITLTCASIVCNHVIPAQQYTPAAESIIYGDADNDTVITSNDALCVLKSVVGLMTPDNILLEVMDVDGDGIVSASDALCILKYVVGLINRFDAETISTEPAATEVPYRSPEPTVESSMAPSESAKPSSEPYATQKPMESLEPTAVPTIAPTVAPTVTPTISPTAVPSDGPDTDDLFVCPTCSSYMVFRESLWSPSSEYFYIYSFWCNTCNTEVRKERLASTCPYCASPGKIIWSSIKPVEGQRSFKDEHYHNHYYCGGCGMDFGKDDGAAGNHITWADFPGPCGNYNLSPAAFYDENTGIWWDYKYSLNFVAYWDDTINGFNYGRMYPDHVHYECTKCSQRW